MRNDPGWRTTSLHWTLWGTSAPNVENRTRPRRLSEECSNSPRPTSRLYQKPTESLAEFTAGAKFRRPRADELKIVAGDYVMLSDFSDADKWFLQVVSETPNDADAWYLLGRTKYNENEFAAAISSFEHALTLHPRYVEAENNIGLCWKELNDRDKARAASGPESIGRERTPVDAQPFLNLGTLLADNNQGARRPSVSDEGGRAVAKNPGRSRGTGQGLSGNEQIAGGAS